MADEFEDMALARQLMASENVATLSRFLEKLTVPLQIKRM